MAHALKIAGSCLLSVILAGCGTLSPKTGSERLSHVLTTQEQADAAYRANDMRHAAALYLELTKLVPQEADYWYMLGNAYVRTQQPDEAVQAYNQAISRNPNHTRAWHNLGIVRMRQAVAAFVSSASTAKTGDPLYDVSTRLANELARIGSDAVNKPASQPTMTSPLPVIVSRPTSRTSGASRSPSTNASPSAGANPSARATKPPSSDSYAAARKRPGTSAAPDQP
jgi:hypothetical protein